MSEKLAQLEKKGSGELKETVLWTNPSPNADYANATVTLSQSIQNFDFVKIYYKGIKTSTTERSVIFPKETWNSATRTAHAPWLSINCRNGSGSTPYVRGIIPETSNTVLFDTVHNIVDGSTTNTIVIPLRICGLK